MAVKILIKRKFNVDQLQDASTLLMKARYSAMRQPGYISSETLSDLNDRGKVTVVSMWQTEKDWHAWKDSPERAEFEMEMGKIQEGDTEFELYAMGMQLAG
jgi:heme-degrading monooxygenase HmoA